nr:unnamed protein product [Digitaria exilis]
MAISARNLPTAGAILNPCPENPTPTTTSSPNSPPRKSITKSESGVMQHMHDCRITGPPAASTWLGMASSIHLATRSVISLSPALPVVGRPSDCFGPYFFSWLARVLCVVGLPDGRRASRIAAGSSARLLWTT